MKVLLVTLLLGLLAQRAYGEGFILKKCGVASSTVLLESWGFAYKEKDLPGVTNMAVKNKRSSSACTLGGSFGFENGKIWVDKGCRADFTLELCPDMCDLSSSKVRLESWNFAYKEKEVPGVISMDVKNKQSNSACTLGESFGFSSDKIWTDKGCRADFNVKTCQMKCDIVSSAVRMESWGFAYDEQELAGVRSMEVKTQQSQSSCTLGESFGFEDGKIWVDKGCRADFDVERIVCP